MKKKLLTIFLSTFSLSILAANHMASDREADIRNTKHNFAAGDLVDLPGSATRKVTAASEKELCVYCHTPHGPQSVNEQNGLPGPQTTTEKFLWNHQNSTATYTPYASSSLNTTDAQTPGTGSKMCLSCHDGTVAIGQVNALNSRGPQNITMVGENLDGDGSLAAGTDGFTSNLGTDLSNDHPIGFDYDTSLATADKELFDPASDGTHIGVRVGAGVANFNTVQSQTQTSTDPTNEPTTSITRIAVPLESNATAFEAETSGFVTVSATGTVECTTCHDPHIRSSENSENIKFLRLHRLQKAAPADGTFAIDSDINCLACHKKSGWAASAHASQTIATQTYVSDEADKREIPRTTEIWQTSCNSCHDPHTVTDGRRLMRQSIASGATEHDVDKTCYECHGNNKANIVDDPDGLIKNIQNIGEHSTFDFDNNKDSHDITNGDFQESQTSLQDRHVTCTDCHNPHRLQSGLHVNSGSSDNNNVSGALSGISGVQIDSFPAGFDPYAGNDTYLDNISGDPFIAEKEYEICFKCHSGYSITSFGTGAGQLVNTAIEFSTDNARQGGHPVVEATSANATLVSENTLNAPFNTGVGVQTMYCSDCHTSNSGVAGSHNGELLADGSTLTTYDDNFCVTCHVDEQYKTPGATVIENSGFSCAAGDNTDCVAPHDDGNANNLHVFHLTVSTPPSGCSECHVQIPHGWRNRALLVDVDEADLGLQTRYYPTSTNNIVGAIPPSGTWKKASCTGCH